MRILIVSQYYAPDITAAAFRISETAELLREAGHDVHVITAVPHRSDATADRAADKRNGVVRVPVVPGDGGGAWRYLSHYLSFVAGSTLAGVKEWSGAWRPEVIWASSPPLFVGLTGWALARLNRCPLVLDIRDIWPQSAVAAGQIAGTGYALRMGSSLEKKLYDAARHITCVSAAMAEYIATRTRTAVSVIYNGVSAAYAEHPRPAVDRRRILYAGNLGRVQSLDVVIRAFARAASAGAVSGWTLEFMGTGALRNELEQLAASIGMGERIHFHPPAAKALAMDELARSAMLLISLRSDDVFDLTIPSKVFDYMSVGRPILFGINGEGRELLESTNANIGFLPGDEEFLRASMLEAVNRYPELDTLAWRNAEAVTDRYSREVNVGKLASVFDRVCTERG